MDAGTWWATVHGVAKSRTRLSDFTLTFQGGDQTAFSDRPATHSPILSLLFTFLSDVSAVSISCLWVVGREILAFSIGWLA